MLSVTKLVLVIISVGVQQIICTTKPPCATRRGPNGEITLNGSWINELGSVVEFNSTNGELTGKYTTGVGNAGSIYDLTGRYTMGGPKKDVIIATWVVSWHNDVQGNAESSTSWNGIYYPDEGVIYTQWLLVRYTDRTNYWQSTHIGHEEFTIDSKNC
ncbi:hypothetical protein ACF0H5_017639 [Mactra antiquata]